MKYIEYFNHILFVEDMCSKVIHGWEKSTTRYVRWYYEMSHCYMILTSEIYPNISTKKEALPKEVENDGTMNVLVSARVHI